MATNLYEMALMEDMADAVDVGLQLLNKDLVEASKTMPLDEVRHLVDAYYAIQKNRVAAAAQVRALEKAERSHFVISWLADQHRILETQVKRVLDKWGDEQPVASWAKSITGIGPVISAGLEAHIDIKKCPTAGHIWSFAGLNPTMMWEKGKKRPWNADFKCLVAFKLGECFVKVQNLKHDYYGKLFAERRRLEEERNERGEFAAQAAAAMAKKKFGKDTIALGEYAKGKLPKAHLHARARRYAVKMFLSHYHLVAYFNHYGEMPPFPFVFVGPGADKHVHFMPVPNTHLIPGLDKAHAKYVNDLRKRQK